MANFKKFDESLLHEFKSSTQESLEDLSVDAEELDKIEFEVSESFREVDLRVDYSDFANHIFYGSAYASVNFSLKRILDDYPIDGELKDKNEWKRVNSGYENYFFDEYPKRQGYLFLQTGSFENWVEFVDHEHKLRPGTGSVCVDLVIDPYDQINEAAHQKTVFSYKQDDDSEGFWAYFQGLSKTLSFQVASGSTGSIVNLSYDPCISSSHAVSFLYDAINNVQAIFVDGVVAASRSMDFEFPVGLGEVNVLNSRFRIGAMSGAVASTTQVGALYTGSIDEVRYWTGPLRKSEQIKRNYFKTTHAHVSGGLKLYYKFNEPEEIGTTVLDYSGYENHGSLSGTTATYSFSNNIRSGTLGSWFKDSGDPIFALNNSEVDSFITAQRASGTLHDRNNRNYIFNLVPSFFIDEGDDHEDMQRFLLLVARHYDKLKLYIKHLANIHNTEQADYNNTPDELIGIVAEHYGIDVGSVYEAATPLQYFFGEDVLPSGSLNNSVQKIRNQLRRNLLSNLIYIIKTKSTRESLEASIRSLGLDEDVVNINEYSIFSGGIEASRILRNVERRVANFTTSSIVTLHSSSLFDNSPPIAGPDERSYEVRVLFNTASVYNTASVFSFFTGSPDRPTYYLEVERDNLTSSYGVAKLYFTTGSVDEALVVSSSRQPFYDNKWVSFGSTIDTGITITNVSLHVNAFDQSDVYFSEAVSGTQSHLVERLAETGTLGTRSGSTAYFDGKMQEFRVWSGLLSQSVFFDHAKDFESLTTPNFSKDFDRLLLHHKLNDFTGSNNGTAPIWDYSQGLTGTVFSGISSSGEFNFPGVYLDKLEPSYSYDISINKDKIRIRDRESFEKGDIVRDVPYLSVDMSPTIALNKEILKWFGDIDKFNNLIGPTYLRYRDEVNTLYEYRYSFFENRINSKINFSAYLDLLKWFDSNFSYFLDQLLPLEIARSLSNFVVESHLLEFNQNPRVFPYKQAKVSTGITGAIDASAKLNFALSSNDIPLADPGRYGAAVSASAEVGGGTKIDFTGSILTSSYALNFKNADIKRIFTDYLQEDSGSASPEGYGNGWYTTIVTGSDYMKNVLNVNTEFYISGVHYVTGFYEADPYHDNIADDGRDSLYMSASILGYPENIHFTGPINGVQDSRWYWADEYTRIFDQFYGEVFLPIGTTWDSGIGFGGCWGQLPMINHKSLVVSRSGFAETDGDGTPGQLTEIGTADVKWGIGHGASIQTASVSSVVSIKEETEDSKTFILWPKRNEIEPIFIVGYPAQANALTGVILRNNNELTERADSFGDRIEISGGWKNLEVQVIGSRMFTSGAYSGGSPYEDTPIKLKFYFQFFNEPAGATHDFESTFTSSVLPGGFRSISNVGDIGLRRRLRQVQEYEIEEIATSITSSHDFIAHFERPLPQATFMRTYVRVEYPTIGSNSLSVGYKLRIKGRLTKETTTTETRATEV